MPGSVKRFAFPRKGGSSKGCLMRKKDMPSCENRFGELQK